MTVKDLIQGKDYDYISWRVTLPETYGGSDIFWGCTKSRNGKLIPLDGGIYSEKEVVLRHEEWDNPEKNIQNGLTVVIKGNFQ